MPDSKTGGRPDAELLDEREAKEPKKYRVLMHNDDYTTMDFVVDVLMKVFHKSESAATVIMLAIHHNGWGDCGIYTAEVAESKVDRVHRIAKSAGFPLRCSMEGI